MQAVVLADGSRLAADVVEQHELHLLAPRVFVRDEPQQWPYGAAGWTADGRVVVTNAGAFLNADAFEAVALEWMPLDSTPVPTS